MINVATIILIAITATLILMAKITSIIQIMIMVVLVNVQNYEVVYFLRLQNKHILKWITKHIKVKMHKPRIMQILLMKVKVQTYIIVVVIIKIRHIQLLHQSQVDTCTNHLYVACSRHDSKVSWQVLVHAWV